MTYDELMNLPRRQADEMLLASNRREAAMRAGPNDKTWTHDEFKEACLEWISRNRITGGKYRWVESRNVLVVATPRDLKRLLMVRAAVYHRLSDECLEEVHILEELIRRIGRMRYRKEGGLCVSVERKPMQADK